MTFPGVGETIATAEILCPQPKPKLRFSAATGADLEKKTELRHFSNIVILFTLLKSKLRSQTTIGSLNIQTKVTYSQERTISQS